jgi:hypothetical protein
MARLDRTKRIDPAQADNYAEVARRLLLAGRAMLERADARHASALAILSVHAAIASTDSVCVHLAGRKSTSPDHHATLALLRDTVGPKLTTSVARSLERLMGEKDRFE